MNHRDEKEEKVWEVVQRQLKLPESWCLLGLGVRGVRPVG